MDTGPELEQTDFRHKEKEAGGYYSCGATNGYTHPAKICHCKYTVRKHLLMMYTCNLTDKQHDLPFVIKFVTLLWEIYMY